MGQRGSFPEASSRLPTTPPPLWAEDTACSERKDIRHPASFPPPLRGLREPRGLSWEVWMCMCVRTCLGVCVYMCARVYGCVSVCIVCMFSLCVCVSTHSVARGKSSKCCHPSPLKPFQSRGILFLPKCIRFLPSFSCLLFTP